MANERRFVKVFALESPAETYTGEDNRWTTHSFYGSEEDAALDMPTLSLFGFQKQTFRIVPYYWLEQHWVEYCEMYKPRCSHNPLPDGTCVKCRRQI